MNWIEKMIAEQCPNGVERVKLGDVCEISIGEFVHKNNQDDSFEFPVYNGGTSYTGFYNKFNSLAGNVIVSARGANAGFVNLVNRNFWAGNSCYSICTLDKKIVSNIFIYNILKNSQNTLIENQQKGGGIPAISKKQMEGFEIPLPPPSIQKEIVSVLDKFSELIEKTDEEIALRQKQYEYYREKLLTFEDGEVEWKKLGNLCDIVGRIGFRGYTTKDQVPAYTGALSLSPGNIVDNVMDYSKGTFITWEKYEESPEIMVYNDDIIFCKTGSTVGKVAMIKNLPCKATINPQLVVLKNVNINKKYLYYNLVMKRVQMLVTNLAGIGSVPNISQTKLSLITIPLPSPSRQQEIVDILDKFETLISKLKEERELRQKQYEYYREKLLTF